MALIFQSGSKTRRSWNSCALKNGIGTAVVRVDYDSVGVDVPEDVKRVEKLLKT
jgi:hypothetical protein